MTRLLAGAVLAGLLLATPAAAQSRGSDISGFLSTGSGALGVFGPDGPGAAASLREAAGAAMATVGRLMAERLYVGALTDQSGQAIDRTAQLNALTLLSGFASAEHLTAMGHAFAGPGAAPRIASAAAEAVAAVSGLLAPAAGEWSGPSPERLHAAVSALNVLIALQTPAFLSSPPGEFLAVHAVLLGLVGAHDRAVAP
jgi:hypothetical protein